MFWVLLGIVIFMCLLYSVINYNEGALALRGMQGPKENFLFGNALDILVKPGPYVMRRIKLVSVQLFGIGRKFANTYKDYYRVRLLHINTVNIYNPEDIEVVLSSSTHNEKGSAYKFFKPWLQDGLLLSSGTKWQTRRKILTPAFHFNILRHFSRILEENSVKLVKRLEMEVGRDKTDIIPIMSEFTLNSICETAMGTKLDEEKNRAGKEYKQSIYDITEPLFQRFTRIHLFYDWIFNLSALGMLQRKILKIIKSFTMDVINERRLFVNEHGIEVMEGFSEDDDFLAKKKYKLAMLDLLLSAEKEGLIDSEGIQEEVDTFMFEGHDTTAQALVFAVMLLALHKDVQDKVVKELDEIFCDAALSITMQDLSRMKYLECCIKEAMRLYPPVYFISRTLGETVKLSGHTLPAGVTCNVHIYDLHRRADLFPEPLRFDPERFSAATSAPRHPYAYIPFSAGPRNCIGQRFAMMEMKFALAAILRKFELRPVTRPFELRLISSFVLRTEHPIYVTFVKRK